MYGAHLLATVAVLVIGGAVGFLAGRRWRPATPALSPSEARGMHQGAVALEAASVDPLGEREMLLRAQAMGKTGYIISDVANDRVYWSDSLFDLRRVPKRDHFTFDEGTAFVHPDDRARFFALRTAAIAGRHDWELDNRILRGDGTVSWEHAVGRPRFDAAGKFLGAMVILQDITERREREEETQRLSMVAKNTTNSVLITNLDGTIAWANEGFTRSSGYSLDEARGKRAFDLLRGPETDQAVVAKVREHIARGEGFADLEVQNRAKDGHSYWINVETQPIRDETGKVVQFISVGTDITARKQAENALRASLAKFAGAFHGSSDFMAIVRTSPDMRKGEFVEVNEACERVSGWRRDEILARPGGTLGMWVDRAVQAQVFRQLATEGHVHDMLVMYRKKSGELFEANLNATRFIVDGETYAIWIIRDVTDARNAERQIRALNAELDARLQQLRAITDNLPGAITYTDRDRYLRFANRTMAEWLCRPIDEIVGRKFRELAQIEHGETLDEPSLEVLSGKPVRFERTITYPDGKIRDVEILYVPDFAPDGSVRGNFAIAIDISERKAIEAENRQLSLVATHTNNSVLLSDAAGRLQWANDAFTRLSGYRLDEVRGLSALEFMAAPDMDPATLAFMREHAARGEAFRDVEFLNRAKDGSIFWTSVEVQPIVDAAGKITQFIAVGTDITARKAAEARLELSQAKFMGAFQSSADAMLITRRVDGVIVEANAAAEQMTGWRREDMYGRSGVDLGLWENPAVRSDTWQSLDHDGAVRDLSVIVRTKAGKLVEALLTASRFVAGNDDLIMWVLRDVSEARAAERKIHELNDSLAKSLRQLRAVADNIPAMIVYFDTEGRFQFLNRTAERWLVISAERAIGHTMAEVLPEDYVRTAQPIREMVAKGTRRIDVTALYPDGKLRSVQCSYVPDVEADGRARGYFGLITDITERLAIEEQLRQSQKMEAIGKLTGGVAHDFNNLLAVISGNLELAEEELTDRPDVLKLLQPAIRATERGATLTQSLLAYSRQQPLMPTRVDLAALLGDMTDLLRRTVPSSIEIKLVVGERLWPSEIDPGQLQNAVLNLVVNARDAMPDGGRLTIEISNIHLDDDYAAAHAELHPGDYIVLAVSDTGHGMTAEVAAHAFEPFFTTKGVGEGTGLGLSMVYGFAKQSKGHAKIYSEVGQGTTVRLYLPRAGDGGKLEERAQAETPAARGETILVVEDDPDVRTLAFAMLQSLGYAVLECADAEAALELMHGNARIDLLLTDVMLPGRMNGRELAEKALGLNRQIKVLYMSGYTENAILHHGRLDRGVHLLQKPFRKHDLATKVREVLEQSKSR